MVPISWPELEDGGSSQNINLKHTELNKHASKASDNRSNTSKQGINSSSFTSILKVSKISTSKLALAITFCFLWKVSQKLLWKTKSIEFWKFSLHFVVIWGREKGLMCLLFWGCWGLHLEPHVFQAYALNTECNVLVPPIMFYIWFNFIKHFTWYSSEKDGK